VLDYHELAKFDPQKPEESLLKKIGEAFGPEGLGILAVKNVPGFAEKRGALLPLAAQLPTLPDLDDLVDEASMYSIGWSHGREELAPGKPDTAKGSFYADPLREDDAACRDEKKAPESPNVWPRGLPALRTAFIDMGKTLQKTGILVAAVCDAHCRKHGVETALAETLRRSVAAKGRLLHYFPATDTDDDTTWCAWHNDHGSLTGLVPGMYLNEHGSQVSCPDARSGLYIESRDGEQVRVSLPADACGFQIGETSQIQSGGLLQATPHAVMTYCPGVSRESFALFMQPDFEAPLDVPPGKTVEDCQGVTSPLVPPLAARWNPGHTFGDFHRATIAAFASKGDPSGEDA
jgi:isopenicillin N synthase-like dioxygenase